MFYNIIGLCPSKGMSGAGFIIQLWTLFKELVAESYITQEKVNAAINNMGRQWLDGCGFDAMYDPDDSGYCKNEKKKLGPKARPLYEPRQIRVDWGKWGPEHISVPGDACGLHITIGNFHSPHLGAALLPHNIDGIRQAFLLLTVFTFFVDTMVTERLCKEAEKRYGSRKSDLPIQRPHKTMRHG